MRPRWLAGVHGSRTRGHPSRDVPTGRSVGPTRSLARTRWTARHLVTSLLATAIALVLATGSPPAALADPPPGQTGPWLEVAPSSGRADDSFTAAYWFVPVRGGCAYQSVTFSWDGKDLGTQPLDVETCTVKRAFASPPTTEVGRHIVGAIACFVDETGVPKCDPAAEARAAYTIDPRPTLRLNPAKGLATADFTATYTSDAWRCGFVSAELTWDGKPIDPPADLDGSCNAVVDFKEAPLPDHAGRHVLTATACSDGVCDPKTTATATYVILPPPTPTPAPPSDPAPTAAPTATPAPSVTPTVEPTPPPSSQPTVVPSAVASAEPSPPASSPPTPTPTDTPEPTAAPTGGVLGARDPPDDPSPTPAAAVAVPVQTDAPRTNAFVPAIVSYVGGPTGGPIDAAVVATNVLLTLLLVFLFGLTAEIFNSTMDANRDEIHGWWTRLWPRRLAAFGGSAAPDPALTPSPSRRFGGVVGVVAVLGLIGVIYGFLSPDFGLNQQSVVLFVSLVVGLGFLTYFTEGSSSRLAIRRYRADASIQLYGTAVIVAIVAVVVSRFVTFQPGLVYGFIASAVIVAPVALGRRDDATLVLVPAIGLLVVSLLAWLLLAPVRVAAADGSWAPALAETILAMIVIGGLEGLFVTMIPLRFMDGAAVMSWSRTAWALTFGVVTFLWWQLLLNQDHAYAAAFEQTNVQVVLTVLAVFMLTTGGLWSYFRFRPAAAEVQA